MADPRLWVEPGPGATVEGYVTGEFAPGPRFFRLMAGGNAWRTRWLGLTDLQRGMWAAAVETFRWWWWCYGAMAPWPSYPVESLAPALFTSVNIWRVKMIGSWSSLVPVPKTFADGDDISLVRGAHVMATWTRGASAVGANNWLIVFCRPALGFPGKCGMWQPLYYGGWVSIRLGVPVSIDSALAAAGCESGWSRVECVFLLCERLCPPLCMIRRMVPL